MLATKMEPELVHRFALVNRELYVATFSSCYELGYSVMMTAVSTRLDFFTPSGFIFMVDGLTTYDKAMEYLREHLATVGGELLPPRMTLSLAPNTPHYNDLFEHEA